MLADPPYDVADGELDALLAPLGAPGWLSPGRDTWSSSGRPEPAITAETGFRTGWERTFGDTLVVLRPTDDGESPT